MKKQLDSDREFIRTELDKLRADENDDDCPAIVQKDITADFRENWTHLTKEEKRLFLTKYIKKIVVSNEPIEGSRFGNTIVTHIELNSF